MISRRPNTNLVSMMFRLILISYLAFSTALGPAFCCCQLGRILPGLTSSTCCGHHGTSHSDNFTPRRQDHESHAGNCHHEGSLENHDPNASQSVHEQESPVPCESSCPCGRHDPILVIGKVDVPIAVMVEGWNLLQPIGHAQFVQVASSNLDGHTALFEEKPASLSGMGILRAYQNWRC